MGKQVQEAILGVYIGLTGIPEDNSSPQHIQVRVSPPSNSILHNGGLEVARRRGDGIHLHGIASDTSLVLQDFYSECRIV